MRTNVPAKLPPVFTYEGARVAHITPLQELRRSCLAALLFEDTFYETGSAHATRVADLIKTVGTKHPELILSLAIECRTKMYLRHMPLFLLRELARLKEVKGVGIYVAAGLEAVIQRPDELTEYLALYFKDEKDQPLSAGSKRGLAKAFSKFDEDTLSKYDRDDAFKLRDVLRLVHPKPSSVEQKEVWGRVIKRTLNVPDTWEVALSAGGDKKVVFERLLRERKLGGMAFLRNLRNMIEARVDEGLIRERFEGGFKYVLPFRFIAAARYAPRFESEIEAAMFKVLEGLPKFAGVTALVIDTSPSMWQAKVSLKSELDRFDAAAALAILAREVCEHVHIWAFNERAYEIKPRRGFALRDKLAKTKAGYSCGGLAVQAANERGYDRIIVLTDGEWHVMSPAKYGGYEAGEATKVSPAPLTEKAYMLNVATYKNGVGYGKWLSIDGFSENVLNFIMLNEQEKD